MRRAIACFHPGIAARYARTGASPNPIAICGFSPESRAGFDFGVGLAFAFDVGFCFGVGFDARFGELGRGTDQIYSIRGRRAVGSRAMLLVGQFDSPYVRRVAISMRVLGIAFEHAPWSIGKDQARVAELNPLGQVPTLVLDDGEVLVDSATILDYLDELAGPRALVPDSGPARRRVLHVVAIATGLADKARLQATERLFRPAATRHEPYVQRLRTQMLAAGAYLERICAAHTERVHLLGDALSQAEISLACAVTYAREAASFPIDDKAYSALRERHAWIELQPVFREIYTPFDAPVVD